jgi:hypothetical protein
MEVQIHVCLSLALDGVSGHLQAPATLPEGGGEKQISVDRRVGGPQSRSGPRGEEKCLVPAVNGNPIPRSCPVRTPSLYRFSCSSSSN